jgi:hypothetical protein
MALEVRLYANYGTGEPWLARLAIGLPELIDGCKLENAAREAVKSELFLVVEAVGMAFEALRDIEKLVTGSEGPELRLNKAYANLYGHLWQARKDRWQKVAAALGYNVGFIFQGDAQFERGAVAFSESHPSIDSTFIDMARQDRATWQSALGAIRNEHLEHRATVDPRLVRAFFRPDSARATFDNVWNAIEEATMLLLESALPDGVEIVEIPDEARDRACPKRYGFDVPSLRAALSEHADSA